MKSSRSSSESGFSSTLSMPSSTARAAIAGDGEPVIRRIGMSEPSARNRSAKFKTGHLWHVMVQDQAHRMMLLGLQEFGCGSERLDGVPDNLQQ